MKNILTIIICFTICLKTYSQSPAGDDLNAIKLFVDLNTVTVSNKALPPALSQRLYDKTVQIINQTNIAEMGYSNFLVNPKLTIIDTHLSEAGLAKAYLANCELSMFVSRREYSNDGSASYASFSKHITGSALTEEAAVANAVNSISVSDRDFVSFIEQAKVKINEYFQKNCPQVVKEAEQFYNLGQYNKSIALYFSIPANAPCYNEARDKSVKVYKQYLEEECNKQLISLKAFVARALKEDAKSSINYDSAINIIKNLNPASTDCYAEAEKQIEKIEARFTEEQKREWELRMKTMSDEKEVRKEMYKAMAKINSNYRETSGQTIIVK